MKSELSPVHVTLHTDGKLQGLSSVSTSNQYNPLCNARKELKGSVCQICYSDRYQKMRPQLRRNLIENYKYLTTHELTDEEAAAVPINTLFCRIESFGDAGNYIHAMNMVRIIKTHPLTKFGIWTKNCLFYERAFDILGKPSNCTYVFSSIMIGKPTDYCSEYIDHIFTVYPKGTDKKLINCGSKLCKNCMLCYTKNETIYINEIAK